MNGRPLNNPRGDRPARPTFDRDRLGELAVALVTVVLLTGWFLYRISQWYALATP